MRWLVLAPILLAGCGGGGPVAEPNGTGVLLAYEAGNHLHRYGGRVHGDGRYELFTADGPGAPRWTVYEPFSAEQVATIEAAVEAASAALPDHVPGADPPPPDGATATFTLKGRTVTVDGWPKAAPRLETLLATVAALRRKAPVPSTWRVWSHGGVVELYAGCDIGDVPVLRGLSDALFMTTGADAGPPGADPPAGTPLVAVRFGDEALEVHADGRQVTRAGASETVTKLAPERVNAIRAALAATDWAALPTRLC